MEKVYDRLSEKFVESVLGTLFSVINGAIGVWNVSTLNFFCSCKWKF